MRAMFDIAYHDYGGPTKSERIADREDIPPRFLEQILRKLKNAKLLESRRGPKGGYKLARPPEAISVGDIIRAVEGDPVEHDCCYETDAETIKFCQLTSKCVAAAVWRDLSAQMCDLLQSVSVSDMCRRAEVFGIRRGGYEQFMYVI
jgi:Rrf2 family protein